MRLRKNPIYDQEQPQPIIEVEQKPGKRRVILLIICLSVAAVALGYWIHNLVTVEPGWYTISVETTAPNCGNEFAFQYKVGGNAKEEKKAVTKAYTQAAKEAYELLTWDVEDPFEGGIRYLSDRPNQAVTIDSRLYNALALAKDSRLLFMGPVTAEYSRMFQYDEEQMAAQCDPGQNPEVMAYVAELITFVGSQEHIRLELLVNDRVTLLISQAYLDFAREHGVENFLDLGWMRNAFAADLMADALKEKGYTQGYLVSFDGFGCYLDGEYTLSLSDRVGYEIHRPATYGVTGAMRTVSFRNYPLQENGMDIWRYFVFSNGRIASVYVDPADGICKSATDSLTCYSKNASCAEMVLSCAPLFLTEELDEAALIALGAEGVQTIWAEGKELRYTDSTLTLTIAEGSGYTKKHMQ